MSFYDEWQKAIEEKRSDEIFIRQFLDYAAVSMESLVDGEKADALVAIKQLLTVPIASFVATINHPYEYTAKDIFQFSKLEDATDTLCNILEYEDPMLSYEEAGQNLVHASKQYANIKYGENHAKTAAMLTLVTIKRVEDRKCNVIRISPLGSVMTMLSREDKNEVIRRLAIRNPFLKTLIFLQVRVVSRSQVLENFLVNISLS